MRNEIKADDFLVLILIIINDSNTFNDFFSCLNASVVICLLQRENLRFWYLVFLQQLFRKIFEATILFRKQEKVSEYEVI